MCQTSRVILPYSIAPGATLKIGYTTGGGYANTALSMIGSGLASTAGLYLNGGTSYNVSGGLMVSGAPTVIRQYGSGLAGIGIFDINSNPGLSISSEASGSATDANIQMISRGYGMVVTTTVGAANATGDLVINGPLNVTSQGFYKRGSGSVALKAAANSANAAVLVQGGTIICGAVNCLGASASVPISSGATLALNGFNQAITSLGANSGSTISFGGTNTLTVGTPLTLAGTLRMVINKGATTAASRLIVSGGTLTQGGALVVTDLNSSNLVAGDVFTLFSATGYGGGFTSVSLPPLPVGLKWDTSNLSANGTLTIATVGTSTWTGAGADGNWTTPQNWSAALPANGDVLSFQGTLRQNNTNNLLTSVGQINFGNGGFALHGNSVSMQWGIVSQTGNSSWNINSTLSGPQSFVCSNGTLTIARPVTNGGFTLTLDGAGSNLISGVIYGNGGLAKSGSGTSALSVQNTYTGGTTINGGILNLTGGGGSSGTIRGTATVNTGGTLQLSTGDATGYGGGASALTVINLAGGTLRVNTTANQTLGGAVINLTGGSITGVAGGNLDFFQGASALNTLPSSTTATISGVALSPLRQGSTTFTVAAGSTPSGVDLDISSVLRTSPSGDPVGAVFIKAGEGTLRLSGVNTFLRPTAINAGTLLVNGSLAGALTNFGGVLGGSGNIKGATEISAGGTLAPGNNNIGTLAISNTLVLAGNTVIEISKSGTLSNDLVFVTGKVAYGGRLTVTNINGTSLAVGDSFRLFLAGTYADSFQSMVLPTLATNLFWDVSRLGVDGSIAVANAQPVQPAFTAMSWQGPAGFELTATGGVAQVYILQTASNLNLPVAWSPLLTNQTDTNGTVHYTDLQSTNHAQRFYRMTTP